MTDFERSLRDALAALLHIDSNQIAMTASFDELGVDSLIGLRFARKVQDLIGSDVDAEWLFDHPTLSQLAAFLESQPSHGVRHTT